MQIQRIQSVYLFLVVVLMVVFMFFPVIGLANDNGVETIGAIATGSVTSFSPLLLCLEVLIAVMALFTIFKYRNLPFQMKLCKVNIMLIVTLLIVIGITAYLQKGCVQWTTALPVIALVLVVLAHKGIKHDKKLLSDSERIR